MSMNNNTKIILKAIAVSDVQVRYRTNHREYIITTPEKHALTLTINNNDLRTQLAPGCKSDTAKIVRACEIRMIELYKQRKKQPVKQR